MPSRLDSTWLSTQAGGMHQPILATFRFFGLTDSNNRCLPTLAELAEDGDGRQGRIRALIENKYDWALSLGPNATEGQLDETFREHGLSGSTLGKGVRFFLAGAKYGGIPVSRHFKVPRDDSQRSAPRRKGTAPAAAQTRQRKPQPLPGAADLSKLDPALAAWLAKLPGWELDTEAWLTTFEAIFHGLHPTTTRAG